MLSPHEVPLSPELVEKLRQTGIRLDRQGRFWHEGAEVQHAGLRQAFLRWLDRLEDGRPVLRLDEKRYAYLDVEDAELLAVSARWDKDRAFLMLNDGSEEELDYASVTSTPDNALYCSVRGGRLCARITTPAYYVLAERIGPAQESESEHEMFVIHARGRAFPIRPRRR